VFVLVRFFEGLLVEWPRVDNNNLDVVRSHCRITNLIIPGGSVSRRL
jgi:hypothetical protein